MKIFTFEKWGVFWRLTLARLRQGQSSEAFFLLFLSKIKFWRKKRELHLQLPEMEIKLASLALEQKSRSWSFATKRFLASGLEQVLKGTARQSFPRLDLLVFKLWGRAKIFSFENFSGGRQKIFRFENLWKFSSFEIFKGWKFNFQEGQSCEAISGLRPENNLILGRSNENF